MLKNIKHKPRASHASWTNGQVEGVKRSLEENLGCITQEKTKNTPNRQQTLLCSL